MSDEHVQAMIRELEERYGYCVTKSPCTPKEWRAEANRLLYEIETGKHKPMPVIYTWLEALSRGKKTTEQALLEMVRNLDLIANEAFGPRPEEQARVFAELSIASRGDEAMEDDPYRVSVSE